MESNSTSYSSEDESQYEMQVPERILVVGEWIFVVGILFIFQPLLLAIFFFSFLAGQFMLEYEYR